MFKYSLLVCLITFSINAMDENSSPQWTTQALLISLQRAESGGNNPNTLVKTIDLSGKQISDLKMGLNKATLEKSLELSNEKNYCEILNILYGPNNASNSTANSDIENGVTHLDLSKNSLTTIPNDIGNVTSLVNLNLNENNITTLPSTIGNLSRLEILTAEKNKLGSIPSLSGLLKLQILSLKGNQNLKISKEDVASLKNNLKRLNNKSKRELDEIAASKTAIYETDEVRTECLESRKYYVEPFH